MIEVDAVALVRLLSTTCANAFYSAAGLALSRTHSAVTTEHLLLMLLDQPQADAAAAFRHFGIEAPRLRAILERDLDDLKTGHPGKPGVTDKVVDWLKAGWLFASVELGQNRIRSGALLAVLARRPYSFSEGSAAELLRRIPASEFRDSFEKIVGGSDESREIGSIGEAQPTAGGPVAEARRVGESALARFCVNFTERARDGKVDPVFGRDREIRQMIDILNRRKKNNPIVVGDAGVGKTAVVEGLALRIAQGDVSDTLRDVEIYALDLGLLQAGASIKGEFENRLKNVIAEVKASPRPIVLFIDEAHTLIGAGGSGAGDAANLLKPQLARGELRTVAATTWTEYKKVFEKDEALKRRFEPVKLDEPSVGDTVVILRGLKEKYEAAHKVRILDEAIVAAATLSGRYLSGRLLPDKAVDLLDTAGARVRIGLTGKPAGLEDAERRAQAIRRTIEARVRDLEGGTASADGPDVGELEESLRAVETEVASLNARWGKEKELVEAVQRIREASQAVAPEGGSPAELDAALRALTETQGRDPLIHLEVGPEVVARVVSDWTGIPVGKMVRDEAEVALTLEDRLRERIKGQDHAMTAVAEGIRAAKAGINPPNAPIGVFLFVGPSGVGKTETALTVADLLYGGERFMVTVNMSEFQEKHTVSRLIGSPPGYVGYGEGGVLTEAVRQRPYSVVLLDEVEKADRDVMNLFYQVFDKGELSDGEGQVVDFRNTVIFMTSNLATDTIMEMAQSPVRPEPGEIVSAIRPTLNRHFQPALVARMTLVPFFPIAAEVMGEIVRLKLGRLAARLAESHRIRMTFTDQTVSRIADRCVEVDTGARNIDHILRGSLLPRISREILQRMVSGEMPSSLDLDLPADGDFVLRFTP